MVTKWWKNFIKSYLAQGGSQYGFNLPIKNTQNQSYVVSSSSYINFGNPTSLTTNANNTGISVGTGDTAPTDENYNLQSTITSGLSGVITNTHGMDGDKPYVQYNIVLTNTTANDIIVKEVGIKQNIYAVSSAGATSGGSNKTCLIDRTVLTTPVTVPAGGNAAIKYILKTDYDFS